MQRASARPATTTRAVAVLLLLVAASYAGVWYAGFVWDDLPLLVDNRFLGPTVDAGGLLTGDLWAGAPVDDGASGYYRPVLLLSFALDRVLFDLAPGPAHLHSVGWHLLVVLGTWWLLRPRLSWQAALAGAALVGLHPAASEAVIWLAARNDPMALALGLLALVAVQPRTVRSARLGLGALLACLALLSKESVVLLPVLLVLLDLADAGGDRSPVGPLRRYVALGLGLAAALVLRGLADVGSAGTPPAEGVALLLRHPAQVAGLYGATLFSPWPLSVARPLEWLHYEPAWRTAAGLAGLAALVVLPLLRRGGARRMALAGAAWTLVVVAPTLVAVADKGLYGDRYVYAAGPGLALWLGALLGRRAAWVVAALALPFMVTVHGRAADFIDNDTLWQATIEATPTPYAYESYAGLLRQEGRHAEALPFYVRALEGAPPAYAACTQVVRAAVVAGRLEQAEQLARFALERGCPRTARHVGLLAMLQVRLGRPEEARATLAASGTGDDPLDWDLAARAALARLDGDPSGYDEARAAWTQEVAMSDRVGWLLAPYGLHDGEEAP